MGSTPTAPTIFKPNFIMNYTDVIGKPIKAGDYITYAALDDRSAVLRVGQVIELKSREGYRNGPIPTLFIKSARLGWDEKWERQKNTTLGFVSRVKVLNESELSEELKQLLA